ncbi:MAG: hypothetical protein KDA32_05875 [Phycisphaerales bacterium]|nr:hypothetical protein [Phycisphaerales bacterium]
MTFDTQTLLAYALGETPELRDQIERAIQEDSEIAERYRAVLRTVLAGRIAVDAAPADTIKRAKSIGAQSPAPVLPWRRWLDELSRAVATLVFDSQAPGALVGLRGAAPRQLTLSHDDTEIDVQIEGGDDGARTVVGAIMAADDELPAPVAVVGSSGEVLAETMTDERGEFTLSTTAARFSLAVRLGDRIVCGPDVPLDG